MRRAYLLIYGDRTGTRETIKAWANSEPLIITWRTDLPHSFYIISEGTAGQLSVSLRNCVGRRARFLIAEIGENRQGWLPPETWYFFRNKAIKTKTN